MKLTSQQLDRACGALDEVLAVLPAADPNADFRAALRRLDPDTD